MWFFSRYGKRERAKTDRNRSPVKAVPAALTGSRSEIGVAVHTPTAEPSIDALATVVFVDRLRLDKRQGQGEDADPVVVANTAMVAIGVFDGLGGAGAETYETTQGRRTGAAIGAAVAAKAAEEALTQSPLPVTADRIKEEIAVRLQNCLQQVGGGKSTLKGRLIRKLPTTVALGCVVASGTPDGTVHRRCVAHWAGDSRIYILDCYGLRQLTRDHLATPNDPMQNLLQDSELSNCARADGEFYLESSTINLGSAPFLVIGASDGVFGYLRTPMHFENLLLSTMGRSSSFADWKADLAAQIESYTQDDATMAFAAVGWPDFAAMKMAFATRAHQVDEMVAPLDRAATEMEDARQAAILATRAYESECRSSWDMYRGGYQVPLPEGSR